jgi:hypothetical protein
LGYRDGGRSGEEVQQRLIAGLPAHLAPGGIAQIVTEFGERENECLPDRLRDWLAGAPMDILILRLQKHSPSSYAIGHAGGSSADETFGTYLDSVQAWAANLKKQGYARIVSVLLAFQWTNPASGNPWTRSEESSPPGKNAGREVEAAFAAERLVRNPHFRQQLETGRLRRAAHLGLVESRPLGIDLPTTTQVRQLRKAFSFLQPLGPLERELLLRLEKPMTFSELLALVPGGKIASDATYNAMVSLIQQRLVIMETA